MMRKSLFFTVLFLMAMRLQAQGQSQPKTEKISYDYWLGCETGQGDCLPLEFRRPEAGKAWHLIMPCGGTMTDILVESEAHDFSQKIKVLAADCPPSLDLTGLKDGKYTATMLACNLGGTVHFELRSR